MKETLEITRDINTNDVMNDLKHDFSDCKVSHAWFGWIAIDISVDVTVRLKVHGNQMSLYARRRLLPVILGGGGSGIVEAELNRELDHEHKRFSRWIISKYGEAEN